MKHLMTIAALFVSSLVMAQMPYNPDSNGDNMVGSTDLLSFLSFYGNELIQSNLTCDYEGTELEQFLAGLFAQTLVLDSVYVEYLLIDTVSTFLPGCPDPVDIETVLERSFVVNDLSFYSYAEYVRVWGDINFLGYTRRFDTRFYSEFGRYYMELRDDEVGTLTNFPQTSGLGYGSDECCVPATPCCSAAAYLPFPNDWTLNEDGIQIGWRSTSWVANCQNFRLIPFWSVAE